MKNNQNSSIEKDLLVLKNKKYTIQKFYNPRYIEIKAWKKSDNSKEKEFYVLYKIKRILLDKRARKEVLRKEEF